MKKSVMSANFLATSLSADAFSSLSLLQVLPKSSSMLLQRILTHALFFSLSLPSAENVTNNEDRTIYKLQFAPDPSSQ